MLLPLNEEFKLIKSLRNKYGQELLWHLEAVSQQGVPRLAALPLLKWKGEEQLNEIEKMLDKMEDDEDVQYVFTNIN